MKETHMTPRLMRHETPTFFFRLICSLQKTQDGYRARKKSRNAAKAGGMSAPWHLPRARAHEQTHSLPIGKCL